MRLVSMRFVPEAFDIPAAFSESLEIIIDGAEWNACFFTGLLRVFLALQDRTNQLIFLCCVHSVASRICLYV